MCILQTVGQLHTKGCRLIYTRNESLLNKLSFDIKKFAIQRNGYSL